MSANGRGDQVEHRQRESSRADLVSEFDLGRILGGYKCNGKRAEFVPREMRSGRQVGGRRNRGVHRLQRLRGCGRAEIEQNRAKLRFGVASEQDKFERNNTVARSLEALELSRRYVDAEAMLERKRTTVRRQRDRVTEIRRCVVKPTVTKELKISSRQKLMIWIGEKTEIP